MTTSSVNARFYGALSLVLVATAHNYGQTVLGYNRVGDNTFLVRMSSWPRMREASEALLEAGYQVGTFGNNIVVEV